MKKKHLVLVVVIIIIVGGFIIYSTGILNRDSYDPGLPPAEIPEETSVPDAIYSLDEVATHNTIGDCWQVIEGIVYDFTSYLQAGDHPGGNSMAKDCGTEATFAYENDPPHSDYASSLHEKYAVGRLK